MSTVRGCPPRGLCVAGGISGATMAHCSSVRSDGYFFRDWSFFNIRAHPLLVGYALNYLTNILFCQVLFPDSLSVEVHTTCEERREYGRIGVQTAPGDLR